MYYIVFLEKYHFSPKSGKKPKFSFLPFFSKMIFLNIFHRILVKKIHFGRFDQVSGGGDTSDPRVAPHFRFTALATFDQNGFHLFGRQNSVGNTNFYNIRYI